MKEELLSIINDGVAIDGISIENDIIKIVLSDGTIVMCGNKLLGQIGLDGFWYVNGVKSRFRWDNASVTSTYSNLKYLEHSCVGGDESLLCVLEGYTDWSFYFDDDTIVVVEKSIYSYDPDSILKGVGHRGLSRNAPENTLPAFRLSRLKGFSFVETDVRFSLDGVPVLLHDETIDRTSNGSGRVQDLTLKQLKVFDFGSWKNKEFSLTQIPTFEEFLALCCDIGLSPYIELKIGTREQIENLVALVERYGLLEKSTFVSFNVKYLKYVYEYNSSIRLGMVANSVTEKTISQAKSVKGESNDIYIGAADWSADAINLCSNAGFPLEVWTIDSADEVLSLPDYVTGVVSNSLHAGQLIHGLQVQ